GRHEVESKLPLAKLTRSLSCVLPSAPTSSISKFFPSRAPLESLPSYVYFVDAPFGSVQVKVPFTVDPWTVPIHAFVPASLETAVASKVMTSPCARPEYFEATAVSKDAGTNAW